MDVCGFCFQANFAEGLDGRLHEAPAPARLALEAYVTAPVTARQRTALTRLVARWDAEGRA